MTEKLKEFAEWFDREVETGVRYSDNVTASLGPWSERREKFVRFVMQQAFLAGANTRTPPRVNALEWSEDDGAQPHAMGYRENAACAVGLYWVENHENSGEWRTYFDGFHGDEYLGSSDTEDEAKAAAQADYARRVLACLGVYDD